jgi:type II secretory pathway component PulF
MEKETSQSRLPASPPARFVALLLAADAALIGLIVAIIFATPFWRAIFTALVFILFGGLAVVLFRLARSGRGGEILFSLGRAAWLLASALFWAIGAGLIILALGYGIALASPPSVPIVLYALAFLAILLMAWSGAKTAVRRRRMLLILSRLETAIHLGLPLSRTVRDAAQSETGLLRKRLLALHNQLDRGDPLDRALMYAVPEVPYTVIRAIAAGQQMGCLDHVLEAILRRRSDENNTSSPRAGFYWAYPVVLFAVICLILIAVIPKFQYIFQSFHIPMPPVTRALVDFANNTAVLAPIILVLILIPLGQAISRIFPSFRAVSPFGGIVMDQFIWWTPLLGGLVSDRGMADLCDLVAAAVRLGHPLDETLREAATAQPNAVMRYRTAAWARAVTEGQTMHEAARYARMPELFASMLATVRSNDSLLQVLGFLWRYYEYRVSRTRAVIQALCVPVIVLGLGVIVGILGMSLMQPMAMLSEHIASQIYPGGF